MKTKIFTLFLALVASVGAMFADGVKIGDLYYDLHASTMTAEVTYQSACKECNNYSNLTTLNIPSIISYDSQNYSVTSIGDWAFYYCSSLTSVTIPNSIASIGDKAFYGCSSLTSITIPNSVTSIGSSAFQGCSSLTSVTIPNSVTSIGDFAFAQCKSLNYITVEKDNFNYSSEDGVLFNKDKTELIQYPVGNSEKSYTIPNSVTSIGYFAFANCSSLTSVAIPNSVTEIRDYAFYSCTNLASVTIPNSIAEIRYYAFSDCGSLASVTIPNSVTEIRDYAFSNCSSLTSVICYAETPPNMRNNVFEYLERSKITLYVPEESIDVYKSADEWKYFTNILSIINPSGTCGDNLTWELSCDGVLTISGKGLMSDERPWHPYTSRIKSIIISNGVTSIGDGAFSECSSLTSVTIPNSITEIGHWAFWHCSSLTSVTIPNSVTSIGNQAFYGCSSLSSVTIPNSITEIGDYAFSGCAGLTSPIYNDHVFAYMPRSYSGAYTIPDGIKSIVGGAFIGCTNLTSVTIPNSIIRIGSGAFSGCTSLTSITIPNGVTYIGDGAFYGCSSLTSVTIPKSIASIGGQAFYGCSSLTSIIIPNSVTNIGDETFYGCTNLTSVTIPSSVVGIGYHAFYKCTSLSSVTIPNGVTYIEDGAFSECSGLTSVTIPNSVVSIGASAFSFCTNLSSVTIPNSVTSIRNEAFSYCSSLSSVTIPNSVTEIEYNAFTGCNLKDIVIPVSVDSIGLYAFGFNCLIDPYAPKMAPLYDDNGNIQYTIKSITCYSMNPPYAEKNSEGLTIMGPIEGEYAFPYSSVILYVPAGRVGAYKKHEVWGMFDVRAIGATETETQDLHVSGTSNTTVDVVWPAVSGAATYELVIKDKSGNVICTLIFNANGQLTSIAFAAPARDNTSKQTQAAGFAFTVTGLQEGTLYDLTMTAKDASGNTLDTKSISFITSGGEQGIDEIQGNTPLSTKTLLDGQIYILRGDKMYTVTGQEVR